MDHISRPTYLTNLIFDKSTHKSTVLFSAWGIAVSPPLNPRRDHLSCVCNLSETLQTWHLLVCSSPSRQSHRHGDWSRYQDQLNNTWTEHAVHRKLTFGSAPALYPSRGCALSYKLAVQDAWMVDQDERGKIGCMYLLGRRIQPPLWLQTTKFVRDKQPCEICKEWHKSMISLLYMHGFESVAYVHAAKELQVNNWIGTRVAE